MISEKVYLLTFSSVLILVSIILLSWLIPQGIVEYNLGISIVTSLVSTVLTVVFLSLFLTVREEKEWRIVKKGVYSMISRQTALLFGELLKFTESEMDEIGFKFSLTYARDSKIKKEMIFSKLSELQKREPLRLTSSYVSHFRSDRELLKPFLDARRDIGDIQIRYGKHLTSKITERLIKIEDLLELVSLGWEMDLRWNRLQEQTSVVKDLLSKFISNQGQGQNLSPSDFLQNVLQFNIKDLVQEIYELWKMEVDFEFV